MGARQGQGPTGPPTPKLRITADRAERLRAKARRWRQWIAVPPGYQPGLKENRDDARRDPRQVSVTGHGLYLGRADSTSGVTGDARQRTGQGDGTNECQTPGHSASGDLRRGPAGEAKRRGTESPISSTRKRGKVRRAGAEGKGNGVLVRGAGDTAGSVPRAFLGPPKPTGGGVLRPDRC